jgi:hypothetical protein
MQNYRQNYADISNDNFYSGKAIATNKEPLCCKQDTKKIMEQMTFK